jgi:hypothetical protein
MYARCQSTFFCARDVCLFFILFFFVQLARPVTSMFTAFPSWGSNLLNPQVLLSVDASAEPALLGRE